MEMLQGSTLRERLDSQKCFEALQIVKISHDICAALSTAHRRRLVHRDLKPGNIFLVADELGETVKLLDFGLAKFLSDGTQQPTAVTAEGIVLGTLRYMSPEQRSGQNVHHGWDLWALAVIVYEMLTGCYPFADGFYDWRLPGRVVPFTPVARHMPQASKKWQTLFEHSFDRELSDRHDSVEAFESELRSAAASVRYDLP
jgi:serine/threonine protein kinase